jgi:hypothetical protein
MIGVGSAESLNNDASAIGAMIRSLKVTQPLDPTAK